jgi:hypothetical protein
LIEGDKLALETRGPGFCVTFACKLFLSVPRDAILRRQLRGRLKKIWIPVRPWSEGGSLIFNVWLTYIQRSMLTNRRAAIALNATSNDHLRLSGCDLADAQSYCVEAGAALSVERGGVNVTRKSSRERGQASWIASSIQGVPKNDLLRP